MQLMDEPEPCTIQNIKMSKEGHLMIIPLVKKNLFGSAEYGTIEFATFDTTTLSARPRKLQLNYHTKIDWSYDVTQ